MSDLEDSYPIVANPSAKRIMSRMERLGKPIQNLGMTSDGLYTWLDQDALKKTGKPRIDGVVKSLRMHKDQEIAALTKAFRTEHDNYAEKLDRYRSELNNSLPRNQYQKSPAPKLDMALKDSYTLPIGYDYLRLKFGGKTPPKKIKPPQIKFLFEPIDSSLLVLDGQGRDVVQKLRSRVEEIKTGERIKAIQELKAPMEFKKRPSLAVRHRLLKPEVIENIVKSTAKVLESDSKLKNISISFKVDPQRIAYSMTISKKSIEVPRRVDRNIELFQMSKEPPKLCPGSLSDHLRNTHSHLHCSLDASNVRAANSEHHVRIAAVEPKTNQQSTFDVNRLPYLHICPSI